MLQQHARQYQCKFPKALETVLKSTYMDDSMDSVSNEEQGIALFKELSALLTNPGMHAQKWLINSPEVLKGIPLQDRKSEIDLDNDLLPSAKTLGCGGWLIKMISRLKKCTGRRHELHKAKFLLKHRHFV